MRPDEPPPDGYEYTYEVRRARKGELYWSLGAVLCGPSLGRVWILRRKDGQIPTIY